MTAVSELVRRPRPRAPTTRSHVLRWIALLTMGSAASALTFLIVQPPVGDLWAARARQSAAANGVGLGYWFSWFSGGSTPGNYSVLTPYLSGLLGAPVLGALVSVAITPLTALLARGASHQLAATAVSAFVMGISLWSGRVPFAVGTAALLVAFLAVRRQRPVVGAVAGIVTALTSPVTGAFLVLGVAAVFLTQPRYRSVAAATAGASVLSLVSIAIFFGTPGPQPFATVRALVLLSALGLMLLARPSGYVRVVIVVAMVLSPFLVIIPNGMGASNFQRLVSIYLPVAVIATTTTRLRRALAACALAIALGVQATAGDLWVSAQPISSESYYSTLAARLDQTIGGDDYRVEVVADGTHAAAYTLLDHAMLARGYETQEDAARNAVLLSKTLDAVSYKVWLDNNAVGYVAISRQTLSANPEYNLVRRHLPDYLIPTWSDRYWLLYRVRDATPIVVPPATVIDAHQASLQVKVPRAGSYPVRVHWSKFLKISTSGPAADVLDDGSGYTTMRVSGPGTYTLHG